MDRQTLGSASVAARMFPVLWYYLFVLVWIVSLCIVVLLKRPDIMFFFCLFLFYFVFFLFSHYLHSPDSDFLSYFFAFGFSSLPTDARLAPSNDFLAAMALLSYFLC